MSFSRVYCPGGKSSQSGAAVVARYPNVEILDCGKIIDVPVLLDKDSGPYTIPIWNSNQGEIEASEYVWNLVEEEKIKIFDIWPKSIEFWFVIRDGNFPRYGKIGSVGVAAAQCKKFLEEKKSELVTYNLTTDAFKAFKHGAHIDGVLVAPGQGEDEVGYKVDRKNTANDNNFTSFVTIAPSGTANKVNFLTPSWLTGVSMDSLSGSALDEGQTSFFEQVFSTAINFENVPKLIFVFKRLAKVGLLFEGERFYSGDFLDAEEVEAGDIVVHEEVGELESAYSRNLDSLIVNGFPNLKQDDFTLHRGTDTFLFSCPSLGMYTHGYDEKTVEPVVRFYIDKIFEFIDDGAECSPDVTDFFNRHKRSWEKRRSKFMKFRPID